jgi:superfamily II DNA helicase RecQ
MAYRVQTLLARLAKASYLGYISQFVKDFEATNGPFSPRATAKVVIFCRSKKLVDGLFDALQPQAARFHSSLSNKDKLSQLASFRVGTPILLATSGVGASYDFPDVNLVIHFLPSAYEITNFIQESSRASRSPDSLA